MILKLSAESRKHLTLTLGKENKIMPVEKKLTVLQQQKITKPTPEDAFSEFLVGETKNNALNFIAWLRENKLPPRWDGIYRWKVPYKSKYICYIHLSWLPDKDIHEIVPNNNWSVKPNSLFWDEYGKYITDDTMKQFIVDIVQLPRCNKDCGKKRDVVFLDKMFSEVCHCIPFLICNPNGETLEKLKELFLISKDIFNDLYILN